MSVSINKFNEKTLYIGVAPLAYLHDYRVFDAKGFTREGAVEAAIKQAADDGCNVINLSLGSQTDFHALVCYLVVRFTILLDKFKCVNINI